MPAAPKPINEKDRLLALLDYKILDTLPEKDFDDLTKIASQICGTPISLVSLVDEQRQWFKSRKGLAAEETPREYAFCAHAILEPEKVFVVENSLEDDRFKDNPLATGDPNVIFYAGAPLVNKEGHALGTLCVIDNKPNKLTKTQQEALLALANQVMGQLELRKSNNNLVVKYEELEKKNEELKTLSYTLSHDVKAPLRGIITLTNWLEDEYSQNLPDDGKKYVELIGFRASQLSELVTGIVDYARADNNLEKHLMEVDVEEMIDKIIESFGQPKNVKVIKKIKTKTIHQHPTALYQIFQNLISNAFKYSDPENGLIEIKANTKNGKFIFSVADNGPGIEKEYEKYIFELFQTLGKEDRYGKRGTGVGLSIVQKLVTKMGGEIILKPNKPKGSNFTVEI